MTHRLYSSLTMSALLGALACDAPGRTMGPAVAAVGDIGRSAAVDANQISACYEIGSGALFLPVGPWAVEGCVANGEVAWTIFGLRGKGGSSGPRGVTGPMGADGATGPQGLQGPVGAQGAAGDEGPAGATGDQGPRGEQGEQGPAGDVGPPGSMGPQGDEGDRGPKGPQGSSGDAGDVGGMGPQGPAGASGARGNTGATGPAGVKILGRVKVVLAEVSGDLFSNEREISVTCPAGTAALFGGVTRLSGPAQALWIYSSHPDSDNPRIWRAFVGSKDDLARHTVRLVAHCFSTAVPTLPGQ